MVNHVSRRSLAELIDNDDPGWPLVQDWIKSAKNKIEVLPASEPARSNTLVETQVTTHTALGAIVYETGGILVDNGWVRILGCGHPRLPRSISQWNSAATGSPPAEGAFMLIADDVVGGFYCIDNGALGRPGNVFYLAPDILGWENTGNTYNDFLSVCFNGDLRKYYENARWPGWEKEVATLAGDQGIHIQPPLWAEGPTVLERSRQPMAILELYGLMIDSAREREMD
jgi:hypothetical protein